MVCETIASFIQQELPKRSVDDQRDPTDFSMLPFAEKKLAKLISSPEMHERPPNQLSSYGDAKVTLYDIKRLVRPELRPQMTDTSIYWISDEAINLYTNLLTAIECSPQDCYFFNSLLVELVFKLHHGSEGHESVSQSERESKLQQIADRQKAGRKGQKKDFKTAVKAFAPCNINNNHWVGLRIDKESYEVVSINSLRTGIADDVHSHGEAFASFLKRIDSSPWTYAGPDETFPQQENTMDCGVIVMMGARVWLLNVPVEDKQVNAVSVNKWGRRIAHELLVCQVS